MVAFVEIHSTIPTIPTIPTNIAIYFVAGYGPSSFCNCPVKDPLCNSKNKLKLTLVVGKEVIVL